MGGRAPNLTSPEVVARIVLDMATLSAKLHKPQAGDVAHFTDPFLTDSAVLPVR